MNFYDILDDEKEHNDLLLEDEINNITFALNQYETNNSHIISLCKGYLEQNQALISKKKNNSVFSVEREYINSKAYHDKFEKLPISKEVQEKLYMQTGILLEFVDSLPNDKIEQERLVAMTFRTGTYVVDNFKRDGEVYRTRFEGNEVEKIRECKESLILIHNHSHNGRPSGQDILSYLHSEQVKLSLIACHNGDLYAIYMVSPEFETKYIELIDKYKSIINTTEIEEIKRYAMNEMYELNNSLSKRHKLFLIDKL